MCVPSDCVVFVGATGPYETTGPLCNAAECRQMRFCRHSEQRARAVYFRRSDDFPSSRLRFKVPNKHAILVNSPRSCGTTAV